MKKGNVWLCLLLALTLLAAAAPAAMAESGTEEVRSVPFYSVYEKADHAGTYISIALNSDTEARMRTRLGQIAAASQDRFDDEKTAASVVKGWFVSTRNNIDSLFDITAGAMGTVQIPSGYLKMYDFIAISDAEGRVMMCPFQSYERDLYADLCQAALPVMQSLLDPLVDPCFEAIVNDDTIVKTEDAKAQLEVAYDELRSTFTLTLEDVQKALPPDTQLSEGVTLADGIVLTNNVVMGNLGRLQPVKVATENTGEAWYKLSLSGDTLTGTRLASAVSLNEIRRTTTASATLWLNEAGELIYLTASQPALSADAAALARLLSQQGGEGTGQPDAAGSGKRDVEGQKSTGAVWYAVAVLAVLAVAAGVWFMVNGRRNGRVRSASGGGVQQQSPTEKEGEKMEV